jgi:hypothetical protein
VQLNLSFLDIPAAETHIWETLSNQQKAMVIDAITRILIKTIRVQISCLSTFRILETLGIAQF